VSGFKGKVADYDCGCTNLMVTMANQLS